MEQHTPQPVMIGRVEAAQRLGIGVRTLDRLVAEGAIPSTKIRGRRMFNVVVLDRWAEAQCQVTEAA